MATRTKCILFSESYGGVQNELAVHRTLATIPFGGRYRLIDFILSSLVTQILPTSVYLQKSITALCPTI